MNSFSKMETASDEEEDRLSNLPEFILCHILSFLLTKDAAKTSILSKRWKYLFLAVPKIDLDLDAGDPPTHFIAQRLMLCRTPSITTFRLRCWRLPEASLVHLWLTTLVFRNVRVLDIELLKQNTSGIPKCSLSKHLVWESLVVLKLNGKQIVFKTSESAFFPNLKVLDLKYLEMQSLSQTYRFSEEGYPLLEDLRLEEVTLKKNQDHKPLLHVSLSTLKRLLTNYLDKELSQMDVDTPHLQYLELRIFGACPEMKINICNPESIVSVCLDQRDSGGRRFTKGFSKVNNVKELDVLGTAAKGLVDCVPLPQFPNLTHLKISTLAENSMWNVLQHSPNLEVLHIQSYVVQKVHYTFDSCCPHPENAPPCFARNLREIWIRSSNDTELEIEAVRFILQHGAVLQRLIVYSRACHPWTLPTAMKLLKQKRLSPNCEVELLDC